MLELARGVAQWAHGFKSGVLFLFNTGEEEGLDGAHSFITQVTIFIPVSSYLIPISMQRYTNFCIFPKKHSCLIPILMQRYSNFCVFPKKYHHTPSVSQCKSF